MAYEKHKSEQYRAIGGINEKASNYALNENECLKLENLDFQEPGAYNQRWGTTLISSVGTTIAMNNIWQISNNLSGYTNAGANTIAGNNSGLFSVSLSNGNMAKIFDAVTGQTSVISWSHSEQSIFGYATNGTIGPSSYGGCTLVSGATYFLGFTLLNMYKLANFGGSIGFTTALFSLPPIDFLAVFSGVTATLGGASASFTYKIGLVDQFAGDDPTIKHYGPTDYATITNYKSDVSGNLITVSFLGLTLPAGYSLFAPTHFALYRNNCTGTDDQGNPLSSSIFYLRQLIVIGSTTIITDTVAAPPISPLVIRPDHFYIAETLGGRAPKYLENHLSRLWIATDDLVYFSEVSDPQSIPAFNYFPASNEKYNVTGLKTLHGNLLVFLQKGIKRIVGDGQELADGTTNFAIYDLTKEYGAISHKAIVVFQERCWFLDENCIVEFNGSNFTIVSNRIEDTMKTINYAACKEQASALHVPERREVWFSVPQNGSNFNLLLVYDYVANAWTTFTGINATCLAHLYSDLSNNQLNSPKPYFGTTLGQLNQFDSTFTQDNGVGFTCLVKGRFHNELGNSVHKMFRRVFLDGPNDGVTLPVQLNLYADHATSTISATMMSYVGTTFQYRNDFGVDGKSLAVEFVHSTVNSKYKMFGYVLEYRFLRKV